MLKGKQVLDIVDDIMARAVIAAGKSGVGGKGLDAQLNGIMTNQEAYAGFVDTYAKTALALLREGGG
jgi:hypothetical protein